MWCELAVNQTQAFIVESTFKIPIVYIPIIERKF